MAEIQVQVDYSGQLRTAAGHGEATVELAEGTTLRGLLDRLAADAPSLQSHLFGDDGDVQPSLLLVVNGAAVPSGEAAERVALVSGDAVSLMPPVAGG